MISTLVVIFALDINQVSKRSTVCNATTASPPMTHITARRAGADADASLAVHFLSLFRGEEQVSLFQLLISNDMNRQCNDRCWYDEIGVLFQVLGKEYSKAKWSSKDKLGKWAGSKSKKADVGMPAKPQKRKRLKVNTYKMQDEEERQRICMSYAEDSMPDFLLKFGTVTKLIEDVSEFEMKLKAAEESFAPWRKRRLWKANRGRCSDQQSRLQQCAQSVL